MRVGLRPPWAIKAAKVVKTMHSTLLTVCFVCLATGVAFGQTAGGGTFSPDHGHLPGPLVRIWCVRHIVDQKFELAVEDCKAAIRIDPRSGEPHSNLSAAYLMMRRVDDAIAAATEAIKLEPLQAIYYFNRALAHDAKSDFERSIADYSVAITLDPLAPRAYFHRGLAYRSSGRIEDAVIDLRRAAALAEDQKKQATRPR